MNVYWDDNEGGNDFLDRIGVETSHDALGCAWWTYNGKTVPRPNHAINMERMLEEEFGLVVNIKDEHGNWKRWGTIIE